jgi:hypothetical protein
MSKTRLFETLQSKHNIDRQIRLESRKFGSSKNPDSSNRKRKPLYAPATADSAKKKKTAAPVKLNSIDPIMLIPIGKKQTFKFTRPNGTMVQFNVESLVDYLIATGDFTDPETRIAFSDDDLANIDHVVSIPIQLRDRRMLS